MRKLFVPWLILLIPLMMTSCGDQTPSDSQPTAIEPVRVAYLPIIPDLPIFVAYEQGLFRKHGLAATLTKIAGSGNQVLETLARGDADLAYLAYSTILEAEQQAPGSFMVLQHNVDSRDYPSLYALVAAPASGIESAQDIKGKTIGTFPGAAMLVLTKLMLTAENLEAGRDAKIAQLAPPAQLAALQTAQVDALLALEPIGALAVAAGAGRYVDRWPLTPRVAAVIPTGGSVVLRKIFETRSDYVMKVTAAMDDAIDFIRAHPEAVPAYYVQYCDVPEAVAQNLPILHFWKSTEIDRAVGQQYADLLTREGVLTQSVDALSMYPSEP